MARTDNKRNVVVIYTFSGATLTGCPIEVDSDGGVTAGTEVTSATGDVDAVKRALYESEPAAGVTPPYSADEIFAELFVPDHQIV